MSRRRVLPARPRLRRCVGSAPELPPLEGTLLMPCVMYLSTSRRVMPWPASSCAAYDLFCCSVAASTSPRLHFLPPGALHVQHGRLQHAAEGERLLGLLLLPAPELLDRLFQVFVEIAAQLRQIGAARRENALAVLIVRQRVEQVLERQVRVTPRGRLAIGDRQDDFKAWLNIL